MVRLSVAVQHHPSRRDLLGPLFAALTPGPPPVPVFDPEPGSSHRSAWRTYRRCLEETPDWASHRMILQDDALPCRDFPEAARRAVEARPDALVVFCVLGAPHRWKRHMLDAVGRGQSWAELDIAAWPTWIPVVATCWPAGVVRPALDWIDEQDWPPAFCADDEIVGRVAGALGFPVFATVPSLVEHDDGVESVLRRGRSGQGDPYRLTACSLGARDALAITW